MAKKSNETTPGTDFGNGEWQTHETADGSQPMETAEWVEPGEGTVIEGVLVRAFVMPDTFAEGGKKPYRACYVVRDADGHEWTFGEKAGFKRAIRALTLGTYVRVTFKGKERQTDPKTGKPGPKTIWRVTLESKGMGSGAPIEKALLKSYEERQANGEDLPF